MYRAMLPGLVAVLFQIWLAHGFSDVATDEPIRHPQAIAVLVGSISFLIVFKANQAYSRHWEAYSQVFSMMGRFQDGVQHMMVYHMQSDHFNDMRPPSYFDHPELNGLCLTRDREVLHREPSKEIKIARTIRKSINYVADAKKQQQSQRWDDFEEESLRIEDEKSGSLDHLDEPQRLRYETRLDGGWGKLFPDKTTGRPTATYYHPLKASSSNARSDNKGFASTAGGRTPDLYLQELAHLCSLLNAVALSTLRNDVDGAESPLEIYDVGSPWPEVDPDKIEGNLDWRERLKRMVGADTTPENRTKYNAKRPLSILGGVSNAEIRFLQMARGPYAKTQLAWNWVSEFMIREHLQGSTGKVGDALISRSMQFMSNGMLHYAAARKIMYIPFPFPHAQLAAFFIIVIIPGIPILMYQYAGVTWLGALLSFFVVTCLCGLHEVSRELENPFRKPPNEVPVCTLQAQFNEALITMYSGYHPDAYYETAKSVIRRKSSMSPAQQTRKMSRHETPLSSASRPPTHSMISQSMLSKSLVSLSLSDSVIEEERSSEVKLQDDSSITLGDGDAEIHGIEREIEEHDREMKRLRQELEEKLRRRGKKVHPDVDDEDNDQSFNGSM